MRNKRSFTIVITINLIIITLLVWFASERVFSVPDSIPAFLFILLVIFTIVVQVGLIIQNVRFQARKSDALTQRIHALDAIQATLQDGIVLFTENWRILAANRAFVEMLGLGNGDLVGKTLDAPSELMTFIGYSVTELKTDCEVLVRGEKQCKQEIVTAVGSIERPMERRLYPVRNEQNDVAGWLLVLRDVTEAFELAQMRDEMVHMLVHDLRSPLSVTLGSLETIKSWLEMGRMEDVHSLLELAQTGGDRMLQLLNDMLDTYKFESGQVPLDIEPLSVLPWLSDAKKGVVISAAEAGIEIEIEIEPELPNIMADKGHMARAIHNLLDNAIKFTPNGGHIRLWARQEAGGDLSTVLVGISDTGIGVLPEEKETLFHKFEQGSSSTVRGRRKGTGLGLAYCKLVVEAHNGRIWVESEGVAGRGSTFIMALPTHNSES